MFRFMQTASLFLDERAHTEFEVIQGESSQVSFDCAQAF